MSKHNDIFECFKELPRYERPSGYPQVKKRVVIEVEQEEKNEHKSINKLLRNERQTVVTLASYEEIICSREHENYISELRHKTCMSEIQYGIEEEVCVRCYSSTSLEQNKNFNQRLAEMQSYIKELESELEKLRNK